jgi:hypothetical protein
MSSLLEQASLIVTPNAFKAGKLYSIKPTSGAGDLDVVRATTATRVNSAGLIESVANNVPRLDYTNGSCPSILVEPQRTNLVLRSEEFNDASWGKFDATISANTTISPSGTLTADKLIEGTLSGSHFTNRNITNSNSLFSFSIFAKKSERNFLYLQAFATLPNNFTYVPFAYFNLDNGTVGNVSGATATITSVGDGWYRCTLNCTSIFSQLSATVGMYIMTATANGVNSYLGNGTSGIFIWGAQAEAGTNATSYIPTVASAVTRNADVISKTGISDLIGQTEGTLYWEGRIVGGIATDLFIIGNIANSVFFNITSTNQLRVGIRANSALIAGFFSSALSVTNFKIAIAYKSGDIVAYVNGVQVSTNSTTFTFNASVNEIEIGRQFFDPKATQFMTQALLFKTRLTNAELANLTTL